MEDFVLDQVGQVKALIKPIRLELLTMLDKPRTCSQLAESFHTSPQKIYYHIKVLERSGLVKKVSEKRVRGIMEGYYQAVAESYWLSPQLINQLGGERRSNEQMSLGYVLGLAEQVLREVTPLIKSKTNVPSLGISGQVNLRDETDRSNFLQELQEMVQELAEKYGAKDPDQTDAEKGMNFRFIMACYPHSIEDRKEKNDGR